MAYPIGMLFLSNVFMTIAWYAHLRDLRDKPLFLVILISWGIAFFEYCLQVPGNRIGSNYFTLPQLKIIQEIITLIVFGGFMVVYMKQPLKLDHLWSALCIVGAAYFIFREGLPGVG